MVSALQSAYLPPENLWHGRGITCVIGVLFAFSTPSSPPSHRGTEKFFWISLCLCVSVVKKLLPGPEGSVTFHSARHPIVYTRFFRWGNEHASIDSHCFHGRGRVSRRLSFRRKFCSQIGGERQLATPEVRQAALPRC